MLTEISLALQRDLSPSRPAASFHLESIAVTGIFRVLLQLAFGVINVILVLPVSIFSLLLVQGIIASCSSDTKHHKWVLVTLD